MTIGAKGREGGGATGNPVNFQLALDADLRRRALIGKGSAMPPSRRIALTTLFATCLLAASVVSRAAERDPTVSEMRSFVEHATLDRIALERRYRVPASEVTVER